MTRPPAVVASSAPVAPTAVVAFVSAGERDLASVPGLSVAIMSAGQGRYSPEQLALDLSQGARIASSAYDEGTPPSLRVLPSGGVEGWGAVLARATRAPQILEPGLLASTIPGGAAYAGEGGADAILAADRSGRVARLSLGPASAARVQALSRSSRLVVADLPEGRRGLAVLRELAARRPANRLLIAIQRTSDKDGALLWSGVAGLGARRELTSATTDQRGLIASMDVAPTILAHLGLPVPAEVRGKAIEADGALRSGSLRTLMARLRVVGPRRLRTFGILLCAWALLLLACARRPASRAWAMRVGALGVLWSPVAVLVPAALEPSGPVEYALVTFACLGLGAGSDRLLPWPRAALAPAIGTIAALTADALGHGQLLVRSVLGPNPMLGARFYGIGNELKSGLAVLVLAALAGALYPAARGRRAVLWTVGAGALLAVVEGSARIGAGVGGVILVSAGFALAAAMLAPGAVTRRRALIVLVAPAVGLVALAAIDLLTAHGGGHYTGSVLHASSPGELRDVIVRRYKAAWDELRNHAMPAATALALACAVAGVRRRERLLAVVGGDPAWLAALAGGLAAGVAGALSEDSGPVLLVVAMFALICVCAYLWGRPLASGQRTPGRTRAARSRARTPSGAGAR